MSKKKALWIFKKLQSDCNLWFYTPTNKLVYITDVRLVDNEVYANGIYCISDVTIYGYDTNPYSKDRYPQWVGIEHVSTEERVNRYLFAK